MTQTKTNGCRRTSDFAYCVWCQEQRAVLLTVSLVGQYNTETLCLVCTWKIKNVHHSNAFSFHNLISFSLRTDWCSAFYHGMVNYTAEILTSYYRERKRLLDPTNSFHKHWRHCETGGKTMPGKKQAKSMTERHRKLWRGGREGRMEKLIYSCHHSDENG